MSANVQPRPPRVSRALLKRALPRDVRESIIGDLDERFARDSESTGTQSAKRIYRRKAAALSGRFIAERLRDSVRAIARFRISLLDLRLAFRMLVRYPLLSAVGTVSLALAVAIGAVAFAVTAMLLWPSLPIPDGDRIVSVRMHDDAANRYERRLTADFLRLRNGTATLTDIGAGSEDDQGLTMGDGTTGSVYTAAVTASAFSIGNATPVIGRVLSDEDANPAAPSVIVIGQRLWRERFAADPAILGRVLMLGDRHVSVVGVLPEAFRFPRIAEVWEPLRLDETAAPRTGPGFAIWARLRPGATLAAASSDLAVLAGRNAADWPTTHTRLTPDVRLYPRAFMSSDAEEPLGIGVLNVVVFLLIAVVSGNVALLMFARAATRESEIIVRFALGAGRARLIVQFLAESAVLSVFGFAVGIILAQVALGYGMDLLVVTDSGQPFPFWIQPVLPQVSIAYGAGLAAFAAIVTGVLPAMKVTRGLASRLRERAAGAGGLKFGGVWTLLIVAQVSLTMAVPVVLYFVRASQAETEVSNIGVPATEYLTAELRRDSRMTREKFAQNVRGIRDALPSIPGVSDATVADSMPLIAHWRLVVDVDEGGAAPPTSDGGYRVAMAAVEADFFDHFAMQPLAGRLFSASDYAGPARVAVVNQRFVDQVFGGLNPIGRRVRTAPDAPWLEIVGLVRDVSMGWPGQGRNEGFYTPIDLQQFDRIMVSARVPGAGPGGLTAQTSAFRALAAKVDPSLRVTEVNSLADEINISVEEKGIFVKILSVVSGWVTLLALSGIYAVMSFTVSRRTREIGIRVALGSSRAAVVLAILKRPIVQIVAGVISGAIAGFGFMRFVSVGSSASLGGLFGYLSVITILCLLASAAPIRRALKVDPIAALRND